MVNDLDQIVTSDADPDVRLTLDDSQFADLPANRAQQEGAAKAVMPASERLRVSTKSP